MPELSVFSPVENAATVAAVFQTECFHCHDPLPAGRLPENLRLADKSFCCEGCKMVYEILEENKLCQYYDLDARAGNSVKNQRDARAYAWLDDPETAARLTDFNDGKLAKTTFYLPGMHCAACIWLLEHLYKLDAGVLRSTVNFPRKTVSIDFSPEKTTLRRLAAMLSSIGYPPEINLGDVENTGSKAVERSILYKIGVAGFAFGNIMLLSFPEYLGLEKASDGWFFGIFGYLNLFLALPVLFYSSRDYIISAWNGLKQGHLNIDLPLSLGILMLFGRSAFEILTGTGAGYMDSFAGLVFFLLCGKWFQQKTFHHISFERDYRSYFPVAASVRRGATETSTPLSKLSPGDIIVVRNGELIPADGVLLRGAAKIDYSFVTGEAEPVEIGSGEKVFAGGKQQGDLLEISLTRTVSNSYLTQLWNDESFKASQSGNVSKLADSVGERFTWLILVVGGASFFYWWLVRGDIATGVNAFTAVFMVACPCAIAISIPCTLGNVLRILGRNRFFVKNTRIVEAFTDVSAVVFDKTGTVTSDSGRWAVDGGVTFVPVDLLTFKKLTNLEMQALKALAHRSNHPVSRRIFEAMPEEFPILEVENFKEIPGEGICGFVEGKFVKLGSAKFIFGETASTQNPNLKTQNSFLQIGSKVLGHFEIKNRYREGLGKVMAFFGLTPSPSPKERGVASATPNAPLSFGEGPGVNLLRSARLFTLRNAPLSFGEGPGVRLYLLSGDNDREAQTLAQFFPSPEKMFFNQSPQQKLDFIKNLQAHGERVLFFGDGLNDAGALRQADAGITVTENTNNFTPASDAILHADEFARLPQFFGFARTSLRIVKLSFFLAFCYNLVGLSFAITGTLSPLVAAILMPLSSVTIVLIGIFGSDLAARRYKLG